VFAFLNIFKKAMKRGGKVSAQRKTLLAEEQNAQ
jgi:hypothetical protein